MKLHRKRAAGAAALAVVQVGGSILASHGQPDRADIDVWAVLLLLAAPVALVAARRWPLVPVVVAGLATGVFISRGYPFGPVFAGVAVSLFLAVQAGRRIGVLVVTPLAVAGAAVAIRVDDRSDVEWGHLLIVAGWLLAIVAVSEVVRSRREQAVERRRALLDAQERRLADERIRLAQELHDVLAHNISLINVQASTALHLIEQQPERATDALVNIKRASADALGELRAALDVLRNTETPRSPTPTLADLPALIEGVRASGLDVRYEASGLPEPVPSAVGLAAFRIVQEALTNVTRHSTARTATVQITGTARAIQIEVTDDGRGTAVAAPGALRRGLLGMRERAEALGGTFVAEPRPSGGFRVAARLPLGTS